MNIDEALNQIIFKYHLDKYYPHYRNMYEAEKILQNLIQEIIENKKKVIFVGDNKQGIEFMKKIVGNYADIQFHCYSQDDIEMSSLECVDWKEYEQVYIISLYGAEYAKRWYRLHNIYYEWIYDIFEKRNVFLQKEFFALGQKDIYIMVDGDRELHARSGYDGSLQCELYCQNHAYKNAQDAQTKRIALEKCLFLTLYMKNFVAAKEYVSLLAENNEKIWSMWAEVQELLNTIQKTLRKRQQKDIVIYWMDALGYGEEIVMPYLQNMMDKCIKFEEAYSCIIYTHPVLRTLFLGKSDLHDYTYSVTDITWENSPIMQLLRDEGYDIKIISGILDEHFPVQCSSVQYYQGYDPASMKLWGMLSDMVDQKQKTLYIVHAMEPHFPFLSCKMSDDNYKEHFERYKLAKIELDKQLAFYDAFLHEEAYRIFMSDHGHRLNYHVLFNIYHKTLKPRKINGMFSYLDFHKALRQLIMDGDITESEFIKEYVEIGFLDYYNARDIGRIFRKKTGISSQYFGYTGIIDKKYVYIHNSIGREYLIKRDDIQLYRFLLFYDYDESNKEEAETLSYYRKLAGEYPADIIEDEKFRYSRYLYALYHNIMSHNDIEKRLNILNKLISVYPENSVAIRMGGGHSEILYSFLKKENKEKIWGFIDNNDKCVCSRFNLPIFQPAQMEELENVGVKAVLLSSYDHLNALREESKSWGANIDVLDIYDYLEENGIICKGNFYQPTITEEDYDVGFPFEEVKL